MKGSATYRRMRHKSCKFNMEMGSKPVCGLQVIQQLFTWPAAKRVAFHFITVRKQNIRFEVFMG
jgi:hypothetical protein